MKRLLIVLTMLALTRPVLASDEANEISSHQAITFSVGPDEALIYPSDLVNIS